jgi:hypothetical protein
MPQTGAHYRTTFHDRFQVTGGIYEEAPPMLNLCMPDKTKSCAACCGLMNHTDISKGHLAEFLNDGTFRTANYWRYQIEGSYPEQTTSCRDYSSHICPFHGFIADGLPGCLVHPRVAGEDQRDRGLFGAATCRSYLCPAYELLRHETKAILIDNLDDWYVYTIAIIDPLASIGIIDQLHEKGFHDGDGSFKQALARALEIHAESLGSREGTVFCYSREEYAFASKNHSWKI